MVRIVGKSGSIVKRIWFYEVVDRIFLLTTLNIVFVFPNDGCLFGKGRGKEYTRDWFERVDSS